METTRPLTVQGLGNHDTLFAVYRGNAAPANRLQTVIILGELVLTQPLLGRLRPEQHIISERGFGRTGRVIITY